jgi:predicted nucleotidyltransferase component of viral defense system
MTTLTQLMQTYLAQKDPSLSNETKRILLKEFLQAYILDFLYNHPDYRGLNFYGGTCLHIIYGLNRLSEDIDLDNSNGVELARFADDLTAHFHARVVVADLTAKTQTGAQGIRRITLKFPLLYELGLSVSRDEALHVKVEVSPQVQVAVVRKTPVLAHGRSFVAVHFSLETMMAGKMLACLERNFQVGSTGADIKGRDFYDLLWFMQQKVRPLEEKLAKDGKKAYTIESAMSELTGKIAAIRMDDLRQDLLPLFESRVFVESWLEGFKENFGEYAKSYSSN